MEEVEGKSSLKWYRMVKDEAGLEEYTRSLVSQEEVRLRFRLRTGSAGLFEDKKRCRNPGCVMMKGVCCVTVAK